MDFRQAYTKNTWQECCEAHGYGVNCIVTAGPTFEPLDKVRRLTNFSTGRLGSLLANHLVEHGHKVTLLLGHYSTYHEEQRAQELLKFTTTNDLRARLEALAGSGVDAVYHAAAVSDFGFGQVYERRPSGELVALAAGKIPTRSGPLLAELVPTAKIIKDLRPWFPSARIIGWKYEVDGDKPGVLRKAGDQVRENKTDACVANGPAYGFGFGIVNPVGTSHFSDLDELFDALRKIGESAEG